VAERVVLLFLRWERPSQEEPGGVG
jgi:hypothetical protein